jgi:hypothetical protein
LNARGALDSSLRRTSLADQNNYRAVRVSKRAPHPQPGLRSSHAENPKTHRNGNRKQKCFNRKPSRPRTQRAEAAGLSYEVYQLLELYAEMPFHPQTDKVNSNVMGDDLTGDIRIGESVLFQELEDEVVLLNMENQEYYGLNDVGARMWKSLMETGNVAASADRLSGLYEAEKTVIRADLESLVRDLTAAGLLQGR